MEKGINYFVEDRGDSILVKNSDYGFQELSKTHSPEGTTLTIFQKDIGYQEIPIEKFGELKPASIFPDY